MARCYVLTAKGLSPGNHLIGMSILDLEFLLFHHCLTPAILRGNLIKELDGFKLYKETIITMKNPRRIVILCHTSEDILEHVIEDIKGNTDCARACKERGIELVLKPLDEYLSEIADTGPDETSQPPTN